MAAREGEQGGDVDHWAAGATASVKDCWDDSTEGEDVPAPEKVLPHDEGVRKTTRNVSTIASKSSYVDVSSDDDGLVLGPTSMLGAAKGWGKDESDHEDVPASVGEVPLANGEAENGNDKGKNPADNQLEDSAGGLEDPPSYFDIQDLISDFLEHSRKDEPEVEELFYEGERPTFCDFSLFDDDASEGGQEGTAENAKEARTRIRKIKGTVATLESIVLLGNGRYERVKFKMDLEKEDVAMVLGELVEAFAVAPGEVEALHHELGSLVRDAVAAIKLRRRRKKAMAGGVSKSLSEKEEKRSEEGEGGEEDEGGEEENPRTGEIATEHADSVNGE